MKRTILPALKLVLILSLLPACGARRGTQNGTTGYEVAQVRRDRLLATISASGSVSPARQLRLVFPTPGVLAKVNVIVGEQVEAGQELARLDTRQLEAAVAQAAATLRGNEARLQQARLGPSKSELAYAEAALRSAQAGLDRLRNGPTASELEAAKLAVEAAKNQLWGAQAQRDSIAGSPVATQAQKDGAEAQVLVAETAVQQALLNQRVLQEPPSEAQLAQAESQVAQARSQLEQLRNTPSAEAIAIAESQVELARAALEQAELRLADAILRAPVAGTVALVGAQVGEVVSATAPMIVLADVNQYMIEANVDEVDVGQVQVGQSANITLDAFPDRVLQGQVTEVDPLGTVTQGVVSYHTEIQLPETDLPLRPSMTAIVDIIIADKADVLVVPSRAIKREGDSYYVEMLVNGTAERRSVVTGLSSETMTEILSGLQEGEEVIVAAPRENVLDQVGNSRLPFGRQN